MPRSWYKSTDGVLCAFNDDEKNGSDGYSITEYTYYTIDVTDSDIIENVEIRFVQRFP